MTNEIDVRDEEISENRYKTLLINLRLYIFLTPLLIENLIVACSFNRLNILR